MALRTPTFGFSSGSTPTPTLAPAVPIRPSSLYASSVCPNAAASKEPPQSSGLYLTLLLLPS